ncbi:MAG: hypothetical protein ABIH26_15635 [Candidatus Eisenbacteria bacterium]
MMQRIIAVAALGVLAAAILSQAAAAMESPERIYSKRIRILDAERYVELRDQWKAYAEAHPKDAMGWTELAKAARYAGVKCDEYLEYAKKAVKLDPNYADARAVLGSNNWCMYCPGADEDPAASIRELERALELDPQSGEPHYSLWVMKLSQGKREEADGHLAALVQGGYIPEFLLDMAYNMLVAVEENAIILTNGDNDTYPPLALQAARGIRKDVAIVNLSLLNTEWYRKELREGPLAVPLPAIDGEAKGPQSGAAVMGLQENLRRDGWKRPLYVAITVFRNSLPLPNRLSLEGLVYRALPEHGDEEEIDVDQLEENLERNYRLDSATSLGLDWEHYSALSRLVVNYAAAESRLAKALAEREDLEGARTWILRALRTCEFHGRNRFARSLGRSLAEAWREWDPRSTAPSAWIEKFEK